MKMRKTETYLFGGLFAALLLVSCSSEDTTPHSTPPDLGKITLDQTEDIRPDQWLRASAPLPSGGENILSMDIFWNTTTIGGSKEEDGKSIYYFYAPTTPGKYSLTYNVKCTYSGVNSSGSYFETVTTETFYEVVATDIFSSKWTDTPDITWRTYPTAKEYNHSSDTLHVHEAPDVLYTMASQTIDRYFLHRNNVLCEIRELKDVEMKGSDYDLDCYRLMLVNRMAAMSELNMKDVESYVEDGEGNRITDIPLDLKESIEINKTMEYTKKIYSGEYKKAIFKLSDGVTDLTIKGAKSDKGIRITRSYTKK